MTDTSSVENMLFSVIPTKVGIQDLILVPRFRGDGVWMPALVRQAHHPERSRRIAGMTNPFSEVFNTATDTN